MSFVNNLTLPARLKVGAEDKTFFLYLFINIVPVESRVTEVGLICRSTLNGHLKQSRR